MNTKKFVIRKLFEDLMPIYPLYLIYFENKGLTVQQISVLLAIWSLAVVLLEIPSGVMADRWSRKNMIMIGSLCRAACYLIWSFSDRFELFALGFILWGTGGAFVSGAEEALLFDSLKQEGRETDFDRYLGRGRFLSGIGNILAAVGGGFIGTYFGIRWALYLSVAFCIISAGIACLYKEVNLYRETTLARTEKQETLKNAFSFLFRTKELLVFSLLAVMVVGMAGVLDEYDAVIAKEYGLSMSGIGIWSAMRFILVALGGYLTPFFRRITERALGKKKRIYLVSSLCIMGAMSLAAAGAIRSFAAMGFYGFYYLVMAVADILQEDFIQQRIEEEGRSTVHSILSLSMNLYGILCFCILGLFLNFIALHGMLVCIAGYTAILTVIFMLIFARIKRRVPAESIFRDDNTSG